MDNFSGIFISLTILPLLKKKKKRTYTCYYDKSEVTRLRSAVPFGIPILLKQISENPKALL